MRLLLLFAALSIGTIQGCGSNAAPQADGAVDAPQADGAVDAPQADGAVDRGADAAVVPADATVPIVDCPELACLGAAVGVIVPCQPDSTCMYQIGTASVTRCFTNGVTIKQTFNGTTSTMMSVKKNGAACYSVEEAYTDATKSALEIVYKDASGMPIVTISESNKTVTITVACPGGAAVPVSRSGSCWKALDALGGFIPAFSCLSGTEGPCIF